MDLSEGAQSVIFEALFDEYSRKILTSVIDRPLSTEEICIEQKIPESSCYRRVRELEDNGFLRKTETILTDKGNRYCKYQSVFKEINLTFTSRGIKVEAILNGLLEDSVDADSMRHTVRPSMGSV